MNIENINVLIESKKVTADDFNLFIIEGLPKSAEERVMRRARLKPGTPMRPKDHNPVKKAEANLQRKGDNNPLRTRRGQQAVKRRGEHNKKHSDRFREAIEFINNNKGKTIDECKPALQTIVDRSALNELLTRLLGTKSDVDHDWLYKMKFLCEEQYE